MPEEELSAPKKRTPRKRATPRADSSVEKELPPRRATTTRRRTTTTKKVVAPSDQDEEPTRPARKSPTPLTANAARAKQVRRQHIILGSIVLLGIAASAGVGLMDAGKVDIEARIEARNERIRNNTPTEQDLAGGVEPVDVVAANSARPVLADGGLRGLGEQPVVSTPAIVETATTTVDVAADDTSSAASTTPEIATSSEPLPPETPPADTLDSDSPSEQSLE